MVVFSRDSKSRLCCTGIPSLRTEHKIWLLFLYFACQFHQLGNLGRRCRLRKNVTERYQNKKYLVPWLVTQM
jgi:hypothetical protein